MTIPAFYPVFENGQVLTSEQLNNILDYLEPQGRLTRSRLTGIGIICGLTPNWNASEATLTISGGVAVTSEGYLIAEREVVYDRTRPYTVPVPSGPAATEGEIRTAQYSFLFSDGIQREAFELLPKDSPAAPAESEKSLTSTFVSDKAVLLFLETTLESLKNCDVNDCSDKGSEMSLILRRLLIYRSTADTILADEEAIAREPVNRATHPRLSLTTQVIEKVNPSGFGVDSLGALYSRTLLTAGRALQSLVPAMRSAWEAYRPMLRDLYPIGRFPEGPIPEHHLINMAGALAETPTLVQYFHAGVNDLLNAHNEFIEAAATVDAQCSPDECRFPRHVLAGDVEAIPVSFKGAPRTLGEYLAYNPLSVKGGPAPDHPPAPRRHHFVPSPAVANGADRIAEARMLFARMVLLPQVWATRGLLDAEIRLTPSRGGAAPLGERAIPFYYRFDRSGDLLSNWSWRKVRANLRSAVHSWQFSSNDSHPFLLRQDAEDFIRIEGVVGKPLGTAIQSLIEQKRALGLSFSIEPVWIGFHSDPAQNTPARALAMRATRHLLACRMRDLDVVFLMIMAGIFSFLVWLVQLLGRLNATLLGRRPLPAEVPPLTPGVREAISTRSLAFLALDRPQEVQLRNTSERVLTEVRNSRVVSEATVRNLAAEVAGAPLAAVAVASIFHKVRDQAAGGELISRVRVAIDGLGVVGDRDDVLGIVYPAVALMARAEEMMQAVSARSIADFDEARFDIALRGFADAFEAYTSRAETDATKVPKEVADANGALAARRSFVTAMAAQFNSAGITAELNKRLESMFNGLTFGPYARQHPGMEHRGGTPVGGTFVVVYGSRTDTAAGLQEALTDRSMSTAFDDIIPGNAPAISVERAIKAMTASSRPRSEDVLDEFVVVADFCLPYNCCDGECSERVIDERIGRKEGVMRVAEAPSAAVVPPAPSPAAEPEPEPEPAPPPSPEPPPRTRTGKVRLSVVKRVGRRETPLDRSAVTATELASRRSIKINMRASTADKELEAGKYSFVASSGTSRSPAVEIALRAGATVPVKLVVP